MTGIYPTSKQELRQEVKRRKQQLSFLEKKDYSLRIMRKIEELEVFRSAKNVLSYFALPDEADADYLLQNYYSSKQFYFPRISGNEIEIVHFRGSAFIKQGAFGILEPVGIATDEQVDLAIVPGIAFDRSGNRLGRGKGYYDRFLKHSTACKIGIAFRCQLFDSIPANENDIAMDAVITEQETLINYIK